MKRSTDRFKRAKPAAEPKENGHGKSVRDDTDEKANDRGPTTANASCTSWHDMTISDIFRHRKNPLNGLDCFFSETKFQQIMGPGLSFKDRLLSQVARIKFENQKQTEANLNKNKAKVLQQKSNTPSVKLPRDTKACLPPIIFTTAGAATDEDVNNSMTVKSESLDLEFSNSLTGNLESLKSDLKSDLTVNGELMDLTGEKSPSVNSPDTAGFSTSEHSHNETNVNGLNSLGSAQISSDCKVYIDIKTVEHSPTVPLSTVISKYEATNERIDIINTANICINKVDEVQNDEIVINASTVFTSAGIGEVSKSTKLKPEELNSSYNNSKTDKHRNAEVSLHTSLSMTSVPTVSASTEKYVTEMVAVTNGLNISSSYTAYSETADDITATSDAASTSVKMEANQISSLPSQTSQQNTSDFGSVDSRHAEKEQHSAFNSLPKKQKLNSVSEMAHTGMGCSDKQTQGFLCENLKANTASDYPQMIFGSNDQQSPLDLSVSLSISSCKKEMNLVTEEKEPVICDKETPVVCMAEAPVVCKTEAPAVSEEEVPVAEGEKTTLLCEKFTPLVLDTADMPDTNSQTQMHDSCPAADSSNVEMSSPQAAHELCLIMPSLSSDDEEDFDADENIIKDNVSSSIDNKFHHSECTSSKSTLDTSAFSETQPQPGDEMTVTGEGTNISVSYPLHSNHYDRISTDSSLPNMINSVECNTVTSFGTGPQAYSGNSVLTSLQNMEMKTLSDFQQSDQAALLNVANNGSTDRQCSSVSAWSEVDIPIFSVKEASPEKCTKSTSVNNERKTLQEAVGNRTDASQILPGENRETKKDTKKTLSFKRSDLTKAEHAWYLKLYNKYMNFFMQRGPPPILTELQRKEILSFEALQKRVLAEQAEFQQYLLQNAKKNPQSYTFLKTVARNYATSKAKSYRLNLKYAANFNQHFDCRLPFCADKSPVSLCFQQALLEIGTPPRIKLPDIPAGHKPVPLQYDVQKLDINFPRHSKKTISGFIHHEPVSQDTNVKTLAAKYDFQVVMSSSVLKCLWDNHGPGFERAWSIPVHVKIHDIDGDNQTIVYLDKPLLENDFLVKDYSRLFHKYALRTFVSHPKGKPVPMTKKLSQAVHIEEPYVVDDPFDMMSSNVDSLETFGEGCSKLFRKDRVSTECVIKTAESAPVEPVSGNASHTLYERNLRSSRKYKNWDAVKDDLDEFEITMPRNSKQSPFKRSLQTKSGKSDQSYPAGDAEFDSEPTNRKYSKRDDTNKGKDDEKTMSIHSSVKKEENLFVITVDSPHSPEMVPTEAFIKNQTQLSPTESPASPIASPASPVASPASPTIGDPNCSSRLFIQQIPLSPVRDIPSSSFTMKSPSEMPSFGPSSTTTTSVPRRRSPRKRARTAESPGSTTTCTQKRTCLGQTPISTDVQGRLFTPLDSILGSSFGQKQERNSHDVPKEDPSLYLPPTEVHSSLTYNLWSLGDLNVLIRTRCHGILKDHKKTRKIYLSPKMEYQSTYGLEQVTINEVAKDWVACFIRPGTNLLRARINAFTSEIMMCEELETGQILRSSLNFEPEAGFQFLDRLLQSLIKPDQYLVTHEAGDNFCGIHSFRNSSDSVPWKKKPTTREDQLPWIPIDPTLLLPHHITHNRIPATFLPKDVEIKTNNSGGHNRKNAKNNTETNGTDNNKNYHRKKYKKKGKKNSKN